MRHPPQAAKTTSVVECDGGRSRRLLDELAAEEPLEIRVNGTPITVTMRTPGDDFDLAAGFLLTEGVVSDRSQIRRIAYGCGPDRDTSGNVIEVDVTSNAEADLGRLGRHFMTASSCGICGKTSIESVRARGVERPRDSFTIAPDLLAQLPETLRSAQRIFGRTGGLHAAALIEPSGSSLAIREDIGRHNAVDKIVGHALLTDRVPLSEYILIVSGRGGFEIVQKALVAGVPVVACVSAPSSLAVQLARQYAQTLIGFLRGARFIVYSGIHRVILDRTVEVSPAAVT
jgi:FdhD protein